MTSLYGKSAYGQGLYSVEPKGALALTQANQTLAAGASTTVTGGLSANQAVQTLNAHGTVLTGFVGSLNLVQASQTLVAAGSVTGIAGGVAQTQANQTLSATGTAAQPPVHGILHLTQADQALVAGGLILGWGPSAPCPPLIWEDSELCPPSMWTPVTPPPWQPLNSPGSYGLAQYGIGHYSPSGVSPWYETELCDG